ncbi:tRNA 2-selenouridine(34) synthase MnmH [Alkalihalobacillus sp. AL-G]|uniref:tRNA 2-selenouridine(34) synthase MnmH n=1 Tax=Alkalihalobacillus sp. AL-G TaxID=2926399 RepID=UPI00272C8E21|nr:tRNA 2-selenouridine(34) synthase MnmH [Alkalihalobacillus sp. AL-G]WLD95256.1 tRNA 2-selenouridine(34) synthase MnmH [Alkalihalobacillus sp. AL-G]
MSGQETVPIVSLQSCNLNDYHLIDVRSPGEFEEFHIDEAYNLPIFTNMERAEVGTTYKQIGKEEAKELGLSIVSPKLSDMFKELNTLNEKDQKPYLIYCARGGMRSKSVATVMKMMGLSCFQLEGGIRSYRKQIVNSLDYFSGLHKPFIVLEGLTGTRKTDYLEILQEEGYPVLNLEQMAGHRGSIFGQVGIEGRSQKEFEQALVHRLQQLEKTPYYIIESESKRIGRVRVPDWILNGKDQGHRIHITYPFEDRVDYICEVYQPECYREEIGQAVTKLRKRLKPEVAETVMEAFERNDYKEIVRQLLKYYYDPRYDHAAQSYRSSVTELSIEHFETGLSEIKTIIEQMKVDLEPVRTN